MIAPPLLPREVVAQLTNGMVGPGLGVLAALTAAAADAVSTQPESGVLTIIASVVGAAGVINWGFRRWVETQLRRGEEQRKQAQRERNDELAEDRAERARHRQEAAEMLQRYMDAHATHEAYLLAQIEMWQQRVDAERERTDALVRQCFPVGVDDAL